MNTATGTIQVPRHSGTQGVTHAWETGLELRATYRCPDCGAGVHMVLDVGGVVFGGVPGEVAVTVTGPRFVEALSRHARFNPELHSWLDQPGEHRL